MLDQLQADRLKPWLPYIEVLLAAAAAALWALIPGIGAWPLLLIGAAWFGRYRILGTIGPRTAFDLPLALFLITAALAILSAYNQAAAWYKFWLITGGIAIYYAFVHWDISELPAAAGKQALLLALLGAGFAGFFIVFHDWQSNPGEFEILTRISRGLQAPLPELPSTDLRPNASGGIFALLAPFGAAAIVLAKKQASRIRLITAVISLALLLAGLVLSSSRGAWLALAVAAIVALWLLASSFIASSGASHRRLFFGGLISVVVILGLVIATSPGILSRFLEFIAEITGETERLAVIRNSLPLILDYPFVGAGLGSGSLLYSSYAYLLHVEYSHHSSVLLMNVMIEQGIFAVAAMLWMWLLMAVGVWRTFEYKNEGMNQAVGKYYRSFTAAADVNILLWAGVLSLIAVLVQGLINGALYESRGLLLLFLPFSFAAPLLGTSPKVSPKRKGRLWVIGAAVLILILVVWNRPILSFSYSNYAAIKQSKTELSLYSWPKWPVQDAVRRQVDLSDSIAGYEKALELYSRNPTASRRLGQIELSLGQYQEALYHLRLANQLTPWDNATRQLFGEANLVNGQFEVGNELWKSVTNDEDQLSVRLYWYERIGDEIRSDWLAQALKH